MHDEKVTQLLFENTTSLYENASAEQRLSTWVVGSGSLTLSRADLSYSVSGYCLSAVGQTQPAA